VLVTIYGVFLQTPKSEYLHIEFFEDGYYDAVIGSRFESFEFMPAALHKFMFTIVDAGNNMIALHHTESNRFLSSNWTLYNQGCSGPMDVDKLPENCGAERFIPVKTNFEEGPTVSLYNPCCFK
jgi:hypothetical protein